MQLEYDEIQILDQLFSAIRVWLCILHLQKHFVAVVLGLLLVVGQCAT